MFTTNWQGKSHQEIYDQVNGGPASGVPGDGFVDSGQSWHRLVGRMQRVADTVDAAGSSLRANWQGQAAESADRSIHPLKPWVDQARALGRAVGSVSHEQAANLQDVRLAIQAPTPVPAPTALGWGDIFGSAGPLGSDYQNGLAAQAESERAAQQTMERYQHFSADRMTTLPLFAGPVGSQITPADLSVTGGAGPEGGGAGGTGGSGVGGSGAGGAVGAVPGGAGGGLPPGGGGPGGGAQGGAPGGAAGGGGGGAGSGAAAPVVPSPTTAAGTPAPNGIPAPPGGAAGVPAAGGVPAGSAPSTGGGGGAVAPPVGAVPGGTGGGGAGRIPPGASTGAGRPGVPGSSGLPGSSGTPGGSGSLVPGARVGGGVGSGPGGGAAGGVGPGGVGAGPGAAAGTGRGGVGGGALSGVGGGGAGEVGARTGVGGGGAVAETAAVRAAGAAVEGRGGAVPMIPPGGMVGGQGGGGDRRRPDYLYEDDPDAIAGTLPATTPPVLGE